MNVWGENNMYRALSITEKLYQLGILDAEAIIEWAFRSIDT
jgi:hypothetical protein